MKQSQPLFQVDMLFYSLFHLYMCMHMHTTHTHTHSHNIPIHMQCLKTYAYTHPIIIALLSEGAYRQVLLHAILYVLL